VDKLIKQNIRKQREREEGEKGKKLKDLEATRKRKKDLEQKNEQVRIANKQKTYAANPQKLKVNNWMQGDAKP
jgi:hypothetical protein